MQCITAKLLLPSCVHRLIYEIQSHLLGYQSQNSYTYVTSKCNVGCELENKSKAQHEVMLIIASNVERKVASLHIKTELAHQRSRLLAPICIVIKYPTIITILQFYASHIGTICLADIAFLGSMAIYPTVTTMANITEYEF